MKQFITIFFFLAIIYPLYAQIQPIEDTVVCDHYILPEIEGRNLSGNEAYYTQNAGQGERYERGDTLSSTQQVFAYDPENEFEECFQLTVFDPEAAINMPDTIDGCSFKILPVIEGRGLTLNAAYYTLPEGKGIKYRAGYKLYGSQTLYIYDGLAECKSQKKVYVDIPDKPRFPNSGLTKKISCNSYTFTLPPGKSIPNQSYYRNLDNNTEYQRGDKIFDSGIFECIADTAACRVRDTFPVEVYEKKDFYVEPLDDITVCDEVLILDSIPTSDINLFHNEKYVKYEYRSSYKEGRNCFIDSIPNSECVAKSCFNVTKNQAKGFQSRSKFHNDTFQLCNNKVVDLRDIFAFLVYRGAGYDITSIEDLPIDNNLLNAKKIKKGVYPFLLSYDNPDCNTENDSLLINIEVIDDCIIEKVVILEGHCGFVEPILRLFPYGGVLKNPRTFEIYDEYENNETVKQSSEDTLSYEYIFYRDDTVNDTIFIKLPPYVEVRPLIDQINLDICFRDTMHIPFNIQPEDTLLLFNSAVYQTQPIIEKIFNEKSIYLGAENIIFSDSIILSSQFSDYVTSEQSTYYIDFRVTDNPLLNVSRTRLDEERDLCYKNLKRDKFYFNTLRKSLNIINAKLCPSESYVVQNDTFNIHNPSGSFVLEGQASNGCDSFIEVDLDFYTDTYHKLNYFLCDSDEFVMVNCERFDHDNPSGTFILESASSSGCDSVVFVQLNFQDEREETRQVYLCPGDKFNLNDDVYLPGSFVMDTLQNKVGCDSLIIHYEIFERNIVDTPQIHTSYDCSNKHYSISVSDPFQSVIWPNSSSENNFQTKKESINFTIIDTNGCEIKMNQVLTYPHWEIDGQTVFYAQRDTSIQLNLDTSGILNNLNWTPASNLNCPSCLNPEIQVDTTTKFLLEFQDAKGCFQTFTVYVIFPQEEDVDFQICRGDSLFFNGEWYTRPGTYQSTAYSRLGHDSVYFDLSIEYYENIPIQIEGDTALCPDDTIWVEVVSNHRALRLNGENVNAEFEIDRAGQYSLSGLDMNNCKSTKTFSIGSLESPMVKTEDLLDIHYMDDIALPVQYEGDIIDYQWHPAEYLNCEDCPYPRLIDRVNETFYINVKDQNGCTTEDAVVVRFLDTRYYIPNLVPRNANVAENGIFYVRGDFDTRYDLQVYNRWGELVYEDKGLQMNHEQGWEPDSRIHVGVYTYRIVIYDLNENIVVYGDVTVK